MEKLTLNDYLDSEISEEIDNFEKYHVFNLSDFIITVEEDTEKNVENK